MPSTKEDGAMTETAGISATRSSSENPLVNYLLELRKNLIKDDQFLMNPKNESPSSVFCLPDCGECVFLLLFFSSHMYNIKFLKRGGNL